MARFQETSNAAKRPAKPKQPLSAYNLFFQVERQRILAGTDHLQLPVSNQELQSIILGHKEKTRRIHRKSHGKIGFRELARAIATKWKKLDGEERKVYDKQAVIEKEDYAKNLAIWIAYKALEEPRAELSVDPAEIHHTDGDHLAIFQRESQACASHERPALGHSQELSHGISTKLSRGPSSIHTTLPVARSFHADLHSTDLTQSIDLLKSAIRAISEHGESSSSPVQSSPADTCLGVSDQEMMISPIFHEARIAGYDLFAAMDSHAMDQVFLD